MTAKVGFLDQIFYRLRLLQRGTPLRVHPTIITGIIGYHLLALLACVPWLFSWAGLIACVAGVYVFGSLGINIGFHRLLTHRGFACPKWLERCFSILGTCCWQGTPMNWVAIHRMHHQHSDDVPDPHSPKIGGFFWSHMGWFMVYDPRIWSMETYDRYVRDLIRDRFYKGIERKRVWRFIQFAQSALFFLGGAIGGLIATETWMGGLQLGLSMLIWGVFVRTVLVWHITWSVNSITHMWGYRNFSTRDDSRNNWLVGVFGGGEGWHNNHHAQPRSAAHGMRWFELDWSWATIWALEKVGLAWNVVRPRAIKAPDALAEEGITQPSTPAPTTGS
jgi:stearoyl-CoA desaturase (delta-9 desaturase)